MADIDDELLALAGDASSDEDGHASDKIKKESTDTPNGKLSEKSGAQKPDAKKGKGGYGSEEEEGEALSSSSSSPGSRKSAPMDESESDSDPPQDNFIDEGERYPVDGKFMNSSDKASILSMPEIEREQVLAERAQEVERDRQNRALRQLLNAREAETKKQDKKRKAGAADLEETQRKTSRQRTKLGGGKFGEARSGIDSLKRARAEKNDRQRRRDEEQLRNPRFREQAHDYFSDHDSHGDSEVEWEDPKTRIKKSKSPEVVDAQPANLDDINRAKVGRSGFAKVCFYPGFDEAITGCFVRVVIGMENGQNIYRMAIIKGFTEDKPYVIEAANGKQVKTTKYVRAAHGKAERNWPMNTCSDSAITGGEWHRYKQTCLVEGLPSPTLPKVSSKVRDIHALLTRSWTEEELQEKLQKSGALMKKALPLERNRINDLIRKARAAGNYEKIETLQAELATLEGQKLTPKKPLAASAGPSQQERLAELNRLNRRKNIEEVRQAQIAERRAVKRIEAAIARGEDVAEDHSRRVKTRAKFKYDASELEVRKPSATTGADTTAAGDAVSGPTVKSISAVVEKLKAANVEKKGLPQIRRPLMDDDIIGAIDLGIDIEI